MLKAVRTILFRNQVYNPGQLLPDDDSAMVAAWLEAGSAVVVDALDIPKPRAALQTAQPGREAIAAEPDALLGRIPETPERKKPRRRRAKEP